jgi:hypothetical protein
MQKYRQKGYQDEDRQRREILEKRDKPPGAPRTPMSHERPRSPVMPARRGLSRCAGCGQVLSLDVDTQGQCPKCHFELHSCKQCVNFDTGARFECVQPITVRVAKKDQRNECTFYQMRVTVEKETSSAGAAMVRPGAALAGPAGPVRQGSSARQAFNDLFKKE